MILYMKMLSIQYDLINISRQPIYIQCISPWRICILQYCIIPNILVAYAVAGIPSYTFSAQAIAGASI